MGMSARVASLVDLVAEVDAHHSHCDCSGGEAGYYCGVVVWHLASCCDEV